jgi:cob(I)alamin adenosyltransferase
MAHLYTRTGDDGYTYCAALRSRIPKSHELLEFVGALDEANSYIGLVRSLIPSYLSNLNEDLKNIQKLLFRVGFSLSRGKLEVTEEDLSWLERITDKYYGNEPLRYFILPSGPTPSSALHVARTIVRRAERRLVKIYLDRVLNIDPLLLKIMNRLSDALFAMAVWLSKVMGFEPEPV